jgi:hypothetical protein
MIKLTENSIAIEVPENTQNWKVTRFHGDNDLVCPDGNGGLKWLAMIPEGNWQILGRPASITEDQWKGIVGWFELAGKVGYMDYSFDDTRFPFAFAKDSGQSLLKAKNIDPDRVMLLIKQQNYG